MYQNMIVLKIIHTRSNLDDNNNMKETAKYHIRGYCSDTDGGYDDESVADTLKNAKMRAKQMMSEEHMRIVETLVPIVYVTIQRYDSDAILFEFGEEL